MNTNLQELLAHAKKVTMTPEEREQQRRSFAYGNTKIENNRISRDSIDKAATKLAGENEQEHEKRDS
jgi:hypothetical protein